MKKTISVAVVVAIILMTGMVTGCGSAEVKKLPDEVTVQLKWIHQAQFAGLYVAEKKGFYAEENIDVILIPGGPEITDGIIPDLVKGNSEFAITSGDRLLKARSEGKPVIAIAAIFQRNPYVYLSLKESGIERPRALEGKKLMVAPDGEILHAAMLQRLAIDPNTIEVIIPYERDVTPLITGQIDAHMVYRTGTGLAFDERGYELNVIWVEDYGIRGYGDTIVATEQLIQQDPELVERFLRATMKGWRYAIENPDEAVDFTLEYAPTLGRERQELMMEMQTPIIHTGDVAIGWMEDSTWQGMYQMLLDGGVLAQPIDVAEAYTMQFLNKIYGKAE